MARKLTRYLTASILATASLNCFAGGFQILEQSASGLGNAFAGTSAVVDDASIVFFNPAGTTFFDCAQASFVGTAINVNSDVQFTSSTINGALPIPGNTREDAGGWFAIPAMYFAYPFTYMCNKLAVGIGITAPWGLTTNYTDRARDRYLATHSRITTVNIGPTLAWQVMPNFSIGLGFDAQYLDADLRARVFPGSFGVPDSYIDNAANDWGYGWNIGAIYCIKETNTTLGLAYRSKIHHSPEGDVDLRVPAINTTFEGDLTSDLTLPDVATFSVVQNLCNCWRVIASASWIHWGLVDRITLDYTGAINTAAGVRSATLDVDYDDSWRYALAVNYKPAQCWILRAGVQYDETPVRNVTTENFRLPDNNRFWLAFGANYKIDCVFNVDIGYSHLFISDFNINQTNILGPASFNTRADVKASTNIFALQLNADLG